MIKTLMTNWQDSFRMLAWPEFRLLLLATLNNFARSCRIIATELSVVLALYGIASIICLCTYMYYPASIITLSLPLLITFFIVLQSAFTFIYFLAARGSLERKDNQYFKTYAKFIFRYLGTLIVTAILQNPAITLMALFFYAESPGSNTSNCPKLFPSVWRSIKAFVNFLPIMIVVGIIILFPCALIKFTIIASLPAMLKTCLLVICSIPCLVLPWLTISFFAIFYSKIKHSHYSLFFPK